MIEIPVQNSAGEQTGQVQVDEQTLGGEIRPKLLKQAYVRYHANRRQGSARVRSRGEIAGSSQKQYRQKGTGRARRGTLRTNLLRGGGSAFARYPKSWRQKMPRKMRRLANRNALLAKAVDGEIKIVEGFEFDRPSTKKFRQLLEGLGIDRSCLLVLADTRGYEARSAGNVEEVDVMSVDRLNVFELLNHRYVLVEKDAFEAHLATLAAQAEPPSAQTAAHDGTDQAEHVEAQPTETA